MILKSSETVRMLPAGKDVGLKPKALAGTAALTTYLFTGRCVVTSRLCSQKHGRTGFQGER